MSKFRYHFYTTVTLDRQLTEAEFYEVKNKRLTFNPLDIPGCEDCYTELTEVEEEDEDTK